MDREVHHLHNFLDGIHKTAGVEVRREAPVLNQLLVQEVVDVHHDKLTREQDGPHHFLLFGEP